ncbi:Ig-like domain-containing protein [Ramlibacter tataouinensis]|uniref:Ig-like domain-containing protein n=1 Tax=Ramlibacter tataouinensis TaxID=94132 RepID=UPI0022F3E461|nr:Ig-like domain-containing protein [Ramlibacter tataouinensis]WBY03783.1 Ig-like domain-containing protein [Ramlibacter tataouinensis]
MGVASSVTVTPVNDAPVAVGDSYTVAEGGTLTVAVGTGVLANDTDAEGDGLSALLVSGPANGTLTLNADGSFSYTHNGSETTSDSFTYKVNDGTVDGNTVTVSLTVTPVNDAPVAVGDSYTVAEGGTLTVAVGTGVLANDTDAEGDGLSALLVSGPANGTLTLNADGSFSYTHNGSETTSDSFTYKVNDGTVDGNTVTVSLTVTPVNDAPVAVGDSYTVAEGGTLTVAVGTGVLANDTDAEGDGLSALLVSGPANGTLTLNADGSFSYTHNGSETTSDSFTYKVNDGTVDGNTVTVSLTVTPVNDAPVAVGDSYTVAEGGTLTVAVGTGVLANDTDAEGDGLSALLVSGPANRTLTLNADGSFSYTHNGSETTSDSFTYKVNDGTVDGNTVTVSLTVTPVNDAPVAVGDSYTVAEGGTLTVAVGTGVLANDTDAEGDGLSALLVSGPANGTLTLNADGSFSYTHNGSETTSDSFTYKVNDGTVDGNTVTVSLTVTPVNDAPVAVGDSYTVAEGGTLTVAVGTGVLANDTDAEGDGLSALLVSGPANRTLTLNADGSFSYTHNGSETTSDSFTYKVNDGTVDGNTVTVSLTVTPVNDAPVAVGDSYTVAEGGTLTVAVGTGVLANDTDAEGDGLSALLVSGPANGTLTLNADGSFSYTHNGSETTSDSFTYKVNDGTVDGNTVTVSLTVTPVNDAPVAVGDSYTVAEGGTLTVAVGTGVLANDTDAEGDGLSALLVSGPANRTLTLNADGSFSYTHNGSETTSDSFTYKVNDGTVDGNTVTVSLTVTPVNDAPVAVGDSYTVAEGGTLTVAVGTGVLANDTDAEGDGLSALLVSGPANGTLTLNADGSFSYTHNGSETTSDSFTYKVNDGTVDGNTVTVSLTVTPVNDAPVAVGDSYTVAEGGTLTVAVGTGVLANDTDAEGDGLSALLVSGPANGTLTLNADGSFSYTHNGSETTSDSFTYKVNDGTVDGNTVTVSLTVTPVNDAPVAVGDSYTVAEGGTLTVAVGTGVLANDTDAEGDGLSALLVSGPANGTLTLNADGSFSYTHNGSETTSDSFTYKVNDGTVDGNTVTVSLTVTPVNDAPVAVGDSYTVAEGGTLTVAVGTGVLANDTDAEGDGLSALLVSGPANRTLTLNADGSFSYTHNGSETTSDSFTYKVNDGTVDGNTVTVSLTVTPVNDAPVAVGDSYTVAEGGTLTVAVGTGVLANDTDAEGDGLSALLVSGPANRTLTLNADGSFSYTHNGSETTSDSFTYKVNDGTVDGNTVTVSLTVTPVNDAPVAVGDSYTVAEGGTLTVAVGTGVLANDTDAEGDGLSALLVSGPANRTLTLNADGSFSYTHNGSETTSDSFTYKVNDGTVDGNTVTVSLTVTPVNDAPVAVGDSYTVAEGGTLTVAVGTGVLANDTDAEGDGLSALLVSGPANRTLTLNADGSFSYTHNGSETTSDSFTYKVNDGTVDGNTVTVSLTVTPVNDAPVAVGDSYTVAEGGTLTVAVGTGVLANDTDAEGDGLSALLVSGPANRTLTLNADGSFSYTHNGSETTSDSFTYKVNDGTVDGNTVTVSLTVTPVNDAPVAVGDSYTVAEGGTLTVAVGTGVLANDTDAEGDGLSALLVSGPANRTLTLNADGSFSYTHNGSETTSDSFTYKVNDGTVDGNTVTVSLTVTPVNDAPVAVGDSYTVAEGGTLTVAVGTGVLANDTDAEGDGLSALLVSGPANGTLTLNADGSFSYTHNGSETTSDSFTYKVNDGTVDGNTVTVSLTVTPVNDAPVAVGDSYTVAEGGTLTVAVGTGVLANDTDAEGDGLSALLVSGPANGTLTLNADGSFSYTHNGSETTSDSFTYKVNDGTVDGNTVTVSLTVTPVNDAPVAVGDSYTVAEGGTLTVAVGTGVLANDTDAEGDGLSALLVSGPANRTLTLNADGSFSYTHNGSETTSDSFTYKVNDGTVDGNTVTVSLTVTPVNDAPVAVGDSYTVAEGGTLTVAVGTGVLANDTDAEGDGLSALLVSGPANRTLTLNADGSFSYTHNGSETTSDSFTYKVNDGTVDGNTVTVSLTVTPVNDAPVAVGDSYTVAEGGTLTVAVGTGVLANDTDAEGDGLSALLVSGPANRTLTLNADGSFSYTHNGSETTSDSFTYKVNDGTVDGNTVTVSLTVTPVNDAPVAVGDSYTVAEGGTLTVAVGTGVLANDTDAEGDGLSALLVSGPANRTLTLNADGSFSYTHNGSETTSDSFTYKVNDGTVDGNTVTVSLTVTPVNDAPVAVGDSYTVAEGGTLTVAVGTGVLANDTDAEGDGLSALLVSGPANGTLTLNADGSFSYTHNGSETTSDSFTYKVNDGTVDGNTVTVSLTVTPVNDAPVAVGDSYTVAEGGTLTVAVGTGVLANDTDAEGDGLSALLVSGPANRTLTLNADGSFSYTHNGSETTSDSFTYKVNDGTVDGNTVTVSLTVTPVNDAPVAVGDSYTVAEGGTLTVAVGTGVLANDTDAEGDGLSALLVSGPANRTLTLNADGSFSYTHNGSETTSDSFTYKVNDGTVDGNTVTVSLTVTPVNDAPVAVGDSYTVAEGGTLTVAVGTGVLANDTDAEGDGLSALLVSGPANGTLTLNADGSFSYTHNGSETTSDSFTYKVNDGTVDGNTVTVSLTVTPVNDAPVAVGDSYTVAEGGTLTVAVGTGVLANDTDAEGDGLSALLVSGPANRTLTLNADGSFSYTHNGSETTSDSFTYKVNDGTVDGNTVTVSLTVTPVNDAPVAVGDSYTVAEGGTLTVAVGTGVLANDTDAEGDGLSALLVSGPANGTLTLNADGSFSYTHNGSETTSDSFTYKVNDGTVDGNTVTVSLTVTPVNDAPVAVGDSYTVAEGGTLTVAVGTGVLANDTDAEGDGLSALLVSGPANGTLTLNADGSFSYTHNGSETTSDSFTYKVNDGTVDGNTVTVSLTVTPVNDAPVAVGDSYTVAEGGTLTVAVGTGVLANDTDAEGDGLSALLVSGPANRTLTLNADGSFSYTHNGSETTSDSFTYKVNDGTVDGNTVTVSLTVTPVNDAPVAVGDSYTVAEGGTLTVAVGTGVLANDTDAEGDGLSALLVSGPANRTLTLNADGSFSYTHNGSETTSDSFTYKVNDGTVDGNTVTVSLTVTPVNDAPVAVGDSYTVAEGGTLTVAVGTGVLANDTDAEGDGLSALLVSGPANRTLTLNADGSFSYTHNGSETTSDSFTYKVNDGTVDGNTVTVSLTVTPVNDAPVAVGDSYTVAEGGTLTVAVGTGVLANDTDAEGDGLSALLVSGPANGTLTLNADGSFSYTHNGSETTSDSFTYKVNDGTVDGNTVTVSLTVTPVNDAPVAVGDSYTVAEGGTLTVAVGTGVLANDTDAEGDGLSALLVSGPANGTLTLNADGSFSYTHNGSETTSDSFTYKVNDGTVDGNTVTVSLTVTPVNDAPVAVGDSYTVAEGGTLTVAVGTGVLANDTDAEGDGLSALLVSGPANGTLTLNADGSFSYTHNGSETTSDSFTYKVNDGTVDGNTVTVSLTVTPVNDAPVAVGDSYTVAEGGTLTVAVGTGVLANDTDAEGDGLSALLVSGPANRTLTLNADGSFSYTHNGSETTSDSFTYKVNDGTVDGNTVTVSLTVTPVNDAPVAVGDSYTVAEGGTLTVAVGTGVLANDTDAEGDGLSALLVSGPANGTLTLNADGSFSYTHNGSETTSDSFTYKVNDGTVDGNTVTVSLTVTPVNDAPVAVGDSYTVAEGGTLTVAVGTGVLANDTDAEGDGLSALLVSGPANRTLTLNADGSFSYTHNGSETTSDSFTYKVNDGTVDGNTVTVSLTVTPVNDAPVAVGDSYTVAEGGTLTVAVGTGVLANDTDAEGDGLSALLVSGPANGTLTLNADGSFSYTHNGSETTSDSFTYKVNDGTVDGNTVTVSLTVTPVNDAPVAVGDSYTVAEGGTLTVAVGTGVLANDTDAEGDGLSALLVSGPANRTLTLNADGSFSYTHNGSETTSDSFTYKVNDGTVDGNTVTVSLTVTPVNDAPVAVGDSYTVAEGGTLTVAVGTGVLANDTDAEGDGLSALLVSGPANGTLTLNADGSFSYTHNGSETTSDSFTYKVNDGTVDGNTVTVSLTVTPVNDAPVAVGDSYTVAEGGTLTVAVGTGVLANDTDAEGDGLSALLVSGPANRTLTLNADGSFSYTHNGSETTSDSFTYKVNDGTVDGNTVTVSLTVTPVNDAPVAVGDSYTTPPEQVREATTPSASLTAPWASTAPVVIPPSLPGLEAPQPPSSPTLGSSPFILPSLSPLNDLGAAPGHYGSATLQPVTPVHVAQLGIRPDVLESLDKGFPALRDSAAAGIGSASGTTTDGAMLAVLNGIPNLVAAHGGLNYPVPRDAFVHTDGKAIVKLEARLLDGQPLPSWLAFDGISGLFNGRPAGQALSTLQVEVTARDDAGRQARTTFTVLGEDIGRLPPALDSTDRGFPVLRLTPSQLGLARPGDGSELLVRYQPISQLRLEVGRGLGFNIPSDAFAHTNPRALVRLQATLRNGDPLPGWMAFDGITGRLSGTPPPDFRGVLDIRVVARDQQGLEAVSEFALTIGDPEVAGLRAPADPAGAEQRAGADGDGEPSVDGPSRAQAEHAGDAAEQRGEPTRISQTGKSAEGHDKIQVKRGAPSFADQLRQVREQGSGQNADALLARALAGHGDKSVAQRMQ